jgi:hypothetical protein
MINLTKKPYVNLEKKPFVNLAKKPFIKKSLTLMDVKTALQLQFNR